MFRYCIYFFTGVRYTEDEYHYLLTGIYYLFHCLSRMNLDIQFYQLLPGAEKSMESNVHYIEFLSSSI